MHSNPPVPCPVPDPVGRDKGNGFQRTVQGEIAPDTHAASTPERPEPSALLVPRFAGFRLLGPPFSAVPFLGLQPALRDPFLRAGEDLRVAMQRVRLRVDFCAGRDVGVAAECRRGRRRRHAGLPDVRGRVQTQGFHYDGVQEGEGVNGFCGGEGRAGAGFGGVRVEEWGRQGEEFSAEAGLQVGPEGESVCKVSKGDAGGVEAGDYAVEHFAGDGEALVGHGEVGGRVGALLFQALLELLVDYGLGLQVVRVGRALSDEGALCCVAHREAPGFYLLGRGVVRSRDNTDADSSEPFR